MSHLSHPSKPVSETSPEVLLCLRSSSGTGGVFPLQKRVTRVGRLDDNDIVIADKDISDFHALFQRTQDGGFEIIDQDSNRGLFVNGRREKRARVKPGDVILFGDVEAVIEDPATSAAIQEVLRAEAPFEVAGNRPTQLTADLEAARQEIATLRGRLASLEKAPAASPTEGREGGLLGFSFLGGDRKARKLDQIDANLAERSALLKQVNQELADARHRLERIDPLRSEVKELEARHEVLLRETNELTEARNRLSSYEQDLLEIKGSEDKLRKSRDRLESWVKTLELDRAALEKEVAELRQAAAEARQTRDEAEAQRDDCLSGRDQILVEIRDLRAEQARFELALQEIDEKKKAIAAEIQSRNEELKGMRNRISETHAKLERATADLEEKRTQHQTLTAEAQAMSQELAAFAKSRDTRREEMQELQRNIDERESVLADLVRGIADAEEKRDGLRRQSEEEAFRLSELQSQIADQKTVLAQLRDMANQSQAVRDGLDREAAKLTDSLAELGDRKQKMEARLADLAEGLRSKETLLTETEGQIEDAAAQLETAQQAIAGREKALAHLEEEVRATESALQEVRGEVNAVTNERNQLEAEINRFHQQIKAIEDRRANLEASIAELQEQLRDCQDQSIAAGQQLEELNQQVDHARAAASESQQHFEIESEKLSGIRELNADQKAVLDALRIETVDARNEIDQLTREKRSLHEQLDAMEAQRETLEDQCSELDASRRTKAEHLQNLDREFLALRDTVSKAHREAETQNQRFKEQHQDWVERIAQAEEELQICQAARQTEEARTRALLDEGKQAQKALDGIALSVLEEEEALGKLRAETEAVLNQIASLKADKKQIAADRAAAKDELATLRANATETAARLSELRNLVDSRELELVKLEEELQARRNAAAAEEQAHQAELQLMTGRVREAENAAKALADETAAERKRLAELKRDGQAETERLQATLKRLGESISSRAQELSRMDANLNEKRGLMEAARLQQETSLAKHHAQIDQLLAKRKAAEDDLTAKLIQIDSANSALEEAGSATRRLAEVRAAQERAQEDLAKVTANLDQARTEEAALQQGICHLQQRTAELERLQAEIAAKEAEVKRHEERARLLQERRAQMERGMTLETGTVQAFAGDLIKRIDSLDDLIGQTADRAQASQLQTLRDALLETLEDYSVQHYGYAQNAKIDPVERHLIRIVKSASDRPKKVVKVIETVRRGYRHTAPNGMQTILRKADVVTTNP